MKKPRRQEKIKRMNINLPTKLHNQFQSAVVLKGKKMTAVLRTFIEEYVRKNLPRSMPRRT